MKTKTTPGPAEATTGAHPSDSHDMIRVTGARANNLKDVSVEISKRLLPYSPASRDPERVRWCSAPSPPNRSGSSTRPTAYSCRGSCRHRPGPRRCARWTAHRAVPVCPTTGEPPVGAGTDIGLRMAGVHLRRVTRRRGRTSLRLRRRPNGRQPLNVDGITRRLCSPLHARPRLPKHRARSSGRRKVCGVVLTGVACSDRRQTARTSLRSILRAFFLHFPVPSVRSRRAPRVRPP
jgi:hypothetical protein